MKSVADKVSLHRGITLDRIQYIAYEIICSSFLLNLLNESSKKNSDHPSNFAANDEELDEEPTNNIKAKLIENLKKIGAKDQLLMFVTGLAGAGKSTAIEVAQQFCFEFCRSMDIIWG